MTETTPEMRLKELGITLPEPPAPVAAYHPWIKTGQLLFLSGQLPFVDGKLQAAGKVGGEVDPDTGKELCRIATLNALAHVRKAAGSLDRVSQCVRLVGYVNSAAGFTRQPYVLDGASEFLIQIFGSRGYHARAAIGVSELPLNSPVEIEMIFELAAEQT